jgi:hypothetical protein
MENEIWKPVADAPFNEYYEVSNLGRLRVTKGRQGTQVGKIIKGTPRAGGWLQWTLKAPGGHSKTYLAQRVVAEAFVANPDGLSDVLFRDENRANLNADNLVWAHRSESMKEAAVGRRGTGNPNGRLTDDDIRAIRARAVEESTTALAKEFNITVGHCSNIVNRRVRKHVS